MNEEAEIRRYHQQRSALMEIRPLRRSSYKAYSSLEHFVTTFLFSFAAEAGNLQTGEKNDDTFQRKLMIISGTPGVGKTFVRRLVRPVLGEYAERFLNSSGELGEVTLEEEGEERARSKGKVVTPRDKSLKDKELEASAEELEDATRESIIRNKATLIELVGGATETLLDGQWFGRQLGARLMYRLVTRTGRFEDLPEMEIYFAGLFGGSLLSKLTVPFREDFRNARSLSEAQYIAWLFGKEVPRTELEWRRRAVEGASAEQISLIESVVDSLASKLRDAKKIPFDMSLEQQLQIERINSTANLKSSLDGGELVRPRVLSEIMRDYFERVLKIDADHAFIGFNDPTAEDLGIPDMQALSRHIKSRKARRRLANP